MVWRCNSEADVDEAATAEVGFWDMMADPASQTAMSSMTEELRKSRLQLEVGEELEQYTR